MKKQILTGILLIMIVSMVSFMPSNATTSNFKQIAPGDQIVWNVTDYNESNNIYEPADWLTELYVHVAYYILNIGENVTFLVGDPTTCGGVFDIGNLTRATARVELGLNLNAITGPGFGLTEFNPALLSPTNWTTQVAIANNATQERDGLYGQNATISIGSSYKIVMGENRSTISFNFTWGDQISNTTYDNETGVLVYLYSQFQLHLIEMELVAIIPAPGEIPGFSAFLSILVITAFMVVLFNKSKTKKITKII